MSEKTPSEPSPDVEPETRGKKDTGPTEKGEGYHSGVDDPDATTDGAGT